MSRGACVSWWSRLGVALALLCAAVAADAQPLTYTRDIAPILDTHCTVCHRPGEIGPFSLTTYRDVRQRLQLIADATRTRVMPPWMPRDPHGTFLDDRSLTDAEIDRIQRWVQAGAPEGSPTDRATSTTAPDVWQLGTPDVVVTMPVAYTVPAAGGDVFRTFVLPVPGASARWVRALEFRPGNPRVVHHANIGIDRTGHSQRMDDAEPGPGYVGGMVQDANYPPGYLLGWTPGQRPHPSPDGMPWRLEPGSAVVTQLHLQTTGKPEPLQVTVALYFTDDAPRQQPVALRLGSQVLDIPAGAADYTITDEYTLPVDATLLALQPHAHYLGRRIELTAVRPDGTRQALLTIPAWDFRWQDVYRCTAPMALPHGTSLRVTMSWDNSEGNPRNPSHPPVRVIWGQNTTDEMGDVWLQLVAARTEETTALARDTARKSLESDVAAYGLLLARNPDDAALQEAVGLLSLQQGRPADAVTHFSRALALRPASAPTAYNLGVAQAALRHYSEAVAAFERAVSLDPAYGEAEGNLAATLHVTGRLDDAAAHYARAATLQPDNAMMFANYGRLLTLQRQDALARDMFARALALRGDLVSALTGLSWVLATSSDVAVRRPGQALSLAQRARVLSQDGDPLAWDALAASYAALGNFDDAVTAIARGIQAATATGQVLLVEDMRERAARFANREAFSR